ncbi:MAG: hypothetical protein ACOCG5_00030 [Candidatus Alkaliphilus sp. MAG34]
MDSSIILTMILFIVLISLQYSLNVIIVLLKDIRSLLIQLKNDKL